MNLRAYRSYQALILAALGMYLLLSALDGGLSVLIHPQMILLVVLTALALLALSQAVSRQRPALAVDLAPNVPARALWWLLLPVLMGILVPPHLLEIGAAANQRIGPQAVLPTEPDDADRPAQVVYLQNPAAPDLWTALLPEDGSSVEARQITFSEGRIFDFNVWPDGNWIVYSAENAAGGLDLWRVQREGGTPEQVLPCLADRCYDPAVSPDGAWLIYSRRQAGALAGQDAGVPHLWVVNLSDFTTEILIPDPNVAGFQPVWSPDGRYLAFSDALSGAALVVDWTDKTLAAQPASLNGALSWSPDGQQLIFSVLEEGDGAIRPAMKLFTWNVTTQQVLALWPDEDTRMDYSLPAWSPDGQWLITAARSVNSGPGNDLWRFNPDGSQRTMISPGALYTYGAYSWDARSQAVAFQRFALGSSRSLPQVMVWWIGASEPLLVADGALLPRWLP